MNNISIKRLLKDIKELENNPLENDGIFYKHSEDDLFKGYALIIGPKDTLYEIELKGDTDSIINLNYCVDTTEQIEGCAVPMVGIENLQFRDVLLYPNPMGEILTISGVGGKFDLSILDARGKKIMNLVNQNENALIPTVDLRSGLYFVLIKTSVGDSMYKVVK